MDPTLCNDINIGIQICILVVTWDNSTPLCPRSFKEEDVVMLCIGLGQEHPEDVPWLSDTEVVLALQCEYDMMAATCQSNCGHCLVGWAHHALYPTPEG